MNTADQIIRKKMLLHTCCAPCITVPLERLVEEYEVVCFFYNPNIHPKDEYVKRLRELEELMKQFKIRMIEMEYDSDLWFKLTTDYKDAPEGGERCKICFRMRLEKTAEYAKQHEFDIFATALTISPHKNAPLINSIGNEVRQQFAISYYESNFKKKEGYKRSIELSKKYNLYRQNYCGCIYSRNK